VTKQEARDLSLLVWGYLRDHPDISSKESLPEDLFRRIEFLRFQCPLCEVCRNCGECPLDGCFVVGTAYHNWSDVGSDVGREVAAGQIFRLVEAWVPNPE
jgi:hypothetical protein